MATNKVYIATGTQIVCKSANGTIAIALTNLAHQAGIWSAAIDLGATPRPGLYDIHAMLPYESTGGAAGEMTEVYLATSPDGTNYDGIAVAAAALTLQQRMNCAMICATVLQAASVQDAKLMAHAQVMILSRYILIGVWNNTAAEHLQNDAESSIITITPVFDDIQASA
jgi:hypothetical protein